ncbi:MAG: hypothetical protein EOP33_09685, partial [Rickettsiaceae bacterium]
MVSEQGKSTIMNTTQTTPTQSQSESFSQHITSHKLNGHNFLQWSQSVLMFISGRGKDDYLTGVATSPVIEDPTFKSWKAENSMVMSWLINSMLPEIGETFLLYRTAAEIWQAAREIFSNSEDMSELFETENTLHDLRQGEMSVTQFFSSLTHLWQKIDLYEQHQWTSSEDSKIYRRIVETKRVFKLLSGLNQDLDEVRGRILSTKPLPSLREAFSAVRHEESRRKLMLGVIKSSSLPGSSSDSSALTTHGDEVLAARVSTEKPRKPRPYCDHCRRPGHLRETCWKLHGKPPSSKST